MTDSFIGGIRVVWGTDEFTISYEDMGDVKGSSMTFKLKRGSGTGKELCEKYGEFLANIHRHGVEQYRSYGG